MGRGFFGALALVSMAACVGPNPRWDGPDDAADAADGDDDDTASSTASDDSGGADELGLESSPGGEGSSSDGAPSDDGGEPVCNDDQIVCDGVCKNPDKDKHFCGLECLDCVALLGMDAECDHGECRADSSGPG